MVTLIHQLLSGQNIVCDVLCDAEYPPGGLPLFNPDPMKLPFLILAPDNDFPVGRRLLYGKWKGMVNWANSM